jgi:hypothetical protein
MNLSVSLQRIDIKESFAQGKTVFETAQRYILEHFGQNGLYAAYLLGAAFGALIIYMILKLSLQLVVFVVIPAALSAFILTYFLPYDFYHMLPATAALFTLGLVLRHVAFSKA